MKLINIQDPRTTPAIVMNEIRGSSFVFVIDEEDTLGSPRFDQRQLELFLQERVQEFMSFGSED
jgi:hypothetical protein